jgi:hypothetical protein
MTPPPAGRRLAYAQFTRDVIVNVLANLLAAAVIYLLGIATGLFTTDETAARVAGVIVAVGVVLVFVLLATIYRDERGAVYLIVAVIIAGSAAAATAVLFPIEPAILRVVLGLVGVSMAAVTTRQLLADQNGADQNGAGQGPGGQ